jgi:phage minor structural protein
MKGAMKEAYSGGIYTNLTEETITADWSWKNAQNAILDPKAGLLQYTTGHLIRNDMDVFLLADSEHTPGYRIAYGANMTGVDWDGSVADMVTRIYPTAQTEDGKTLLLPEEYIDTVRTVPFVRPEVLNTGLKVGTEEEQSDGTKVKLDEETVYARMREAANNRFNVDECDKPELTLEVDWIHLPDTEEYEQYAALKNAAPGDWVEVTNGPLGISETIQLTGYTFDPILGRYEKCRFGKLKAKSTVSAYDLKTGSVTGRALAAGSVGGQNIQANTITAREIEAHSITADQIASRSIVTELLAANSITADEINAGSVTAEKIAAQAITA